MFKIFDSKEKRNIRATVKEYPNSKCVFYLDELLDEEGILLAVSTDRESHKEYLNYIRSLSKDHLCFIGDYGDMPFGFIEVKEVTYV